MTERAKLWWILPTLTVLGGGCADSRSATVLSPVYDNRTRQLSRLDWDVDGDGRIDQRTYFVAGAAVRTEIDADADDRIERWEYVAGQASVTHVGSSTGNDGVEDTWTWPASPDGLVRVARAQYRDGVIDRREELLDGALVRAEEDGNRDGLMDRWETWANGAIRIAAYDTSFSRGRPDRRLVYEDGRFAFLELDVDGNGQFERFVGNQPGSGDKTRDRN